MTTENMLPELSVFFPFWNEEKNITRIVEKAVPLVRSYAKKWEILLIDDGSSDKTLLRAKVLSRKYRNVRVIAHTPNRGYGAALKTGLSNSQYKYIVFTDGDGQFDIAELPKFIHEIRTADLVIGFRKKRRDQKLMIRLLLMYLLKVWDFALFRFNVRDIDCGFKMFRKSALLKIMPLRSEGAMITTEILAKAKVRGITIAEVGVEHYSRKYGEQSGANMSVVVRAVFESFILWWDIKNNRF